VSPPPPARKRSRVLPILITIACGLVLAVGSCFGGFAAEKVGGLSSRRFTVLVWGFVTGALVFVSGIIWGLVAFAVHIFRSKKEQP